MWDGERWVRGGIGEVRWVRGGVGEGVVSGGMDEGEVGGWSR